MTAVDVETGEVVAELTAEEAAELTRDIAGELEFAWELITRAYRGRAWAALGYLSWDDYCTNEFGASRLALPREERAEVVQSLRSQGLSLRAIAAATGAGLGTVKRDVDAGVPDGTPDGQVSNSEHLRGGKSSPPAVDATVTGIDGKQYPTKTTTRESKSTTVERGATPKQQHDEMIATSGTTFEDVVAAYPQAINARPETHEGLRRGFIQLQTMTGDEFERREEAFINAIDHACRSDEERRERRENPTEVRTLKCRACGRPFDQEANNG